MILTQAARFNWVFAREAASITNPANNYWTRSISGGSHGYLMNEFVLSILQDRKPLVDITMALNLTVSGIIAHQSALKNGELMKIPQYSM